MCITILPDTPAAPQVSERITFTQVRESAKRAGLPIAHLITPEVAIVPSATSAAVYTDPYILVKVGGAWRCNCPAEGRCWHQNRAEELVIEARGQIDTPPPPPTAPASAPKPTSDKQERYLAALSELYPEAA